MAILTRNLRGEMPFLDHLEELRWRILWSFIAIFAGSIVGFILIVQFEVLNLLINPFYEVMGEEERLIFLSPTEPFFLLLKVGILSGIVLVSPVVIYQIWAFLSPALERHEKRVIIPALYFGVFLFAAGVYLSYTRALTAALQFLLFFGEDYFDMMLQAGPYLSFVTKILIAFGVLFELPVVIMILSALGLVTPKFLREKRRHAIVIITVLASLLTPGDVVTVTAMMMIPMVFLYEFSILLSWVITRRRKTRTIGGDPPDGSVEAE
ncbi:MAG TPA: twin-arginine translocase subunit TatC [Gemmatimonadetes bacterium]|nr:twin-arginine translocase subunit TatC [Gemmatimonadota bacterium]